MKSNPNFNDMIHHVKKGVERVRRSNQPLFKEIKHDKVRDHSKKSCDTQVYLTKCKLKKSTLKASRSTSKHKNSESYPASKSTNCLVLHNLKKKCKCESKNNEVIGKLKLLKNMTRNSPTLSTKNYTNCEETKESTKLMLKGNCIKANHLKTGRYNPNINSFFRHNHKIGVKKSSKNSLASDTFHTQLFQTSRE